MAFFRDAFSSLYVRNPKNIAVLDGLRAVSMLMVLFYHAMLAVAASYDNPQVALTTVSSGWNWVFNGDLGVDLFFVISGFLIASMLLKESHNTGNIDLKRFYTNRFFRIIPAYYFVLGLYVLAGLPNTENILANLLFVNNFLAGDQQAMNWSWSIAVEEQFYFIFPVMLFLLHRHMKLSVNLFWGLLAASFLIRGAIIASDEMLATKLVAETVTNQAFYYHRFDVIYDNLYSRFGCFVAGILAAYYHVMNPGKTKDFLHSTGGKVAFLLSIAVFVSILLTPLYDERWQPDHGLYVAYVISYRTFFAMAAIYLMLSCLYGAPLSGVINFILKTRLWVPFAQLSYSLYLVHPILMFLAGSVVTQSMASKGAEPITMMLFTFGIGFVVSLILSLLIYVFIEKPFMRFRKASVSPQNEEKQLVTASGTA